MATSEVIVSSEGVNDFNCTPCTQRGQFTEANKFCVECGEYFCSTCLSYHEKFGVTKGHTLINCQDVSAGHVVTRLAKCTIHEDKEEDMVCGEHDVVCCRVCIATNHRSCQYIDYLPQAARSFRESDKYSELSKDVKCRIGELQRSCREHVTRVVQLNMRKKTLLKHLQLFKVSMTELIENHVGAAETDIENTYEPAMYNTQKHIQNTNKQLSRLNLMSEDLSNENDPIIVYKQALECKRTLREIEIKQCVLDKKMTANDEALTKIVEVVEHSVKDDYFFGRINIAEEGTHTKVSNMSMLSDGSLCLAHFSKSQIIHMDNKMNEIDTFATKSSVWGICAISQSEIAFTMPSIMKVQFVSYDRNRVPKASFSTKIHCRGIAYCNENIYVAGGGFLGEESGQVNIFDLKGKLLHRFEQDSDGKYFSIPRSVVANTEYIYVTDCQNGVICLDLHGERKWVYRNSEIGYPWGICFTPNANLLISGRDSNNIAVVSKDGELSGELLNENDGVSVPTALSFDVSRSRLLVTTSNGSALKVFEVEDCGI